MIRLYQTMAGARHGGAEVFFERLVSAMAKPVWSGAVRQRVAIRRDARRAGVLRAAGVDFAQLGFGGALDILTPWRLGRDIRAFRPDVVLAWMNRAATKTPPGDYLRVGRIGGYYDAKYYRGFDHLICNAPGLVDHMTGQGWPAERIHYLPNFVHAEAGVPLVRADYATPEGVPLLLALGRLHRNKAYDVLLRALAKVPAAHLWIAGAGPEEAALKGLADELGVATRVRFLGWRDDTANLLATGDILVCPSRIEGLGNVVIEGWAHGLPVVAAKSEGPLHLVRHKETGLLAEIEDADGFAAHLNAVISDAGLAKALVAAGRAEYETRFSEEIVVRHYLELLGSLRK
ncbi:glycosyltransferase [Nisaea acidiphila]|uniref:Glycosyltransferase n=1 Tax=Nisaea acidiphila TaxID=1862145 RepID=A0A9J7AS91_9PROT|nr:glycosyltransferase [Nisaea acidiphila]UUX49417.1 glycosyltransferase [Nisaea acidiphila]